MKEFSACRIATLQSAIVVAEFLGTCLWFSAAAVSSEIGQSVGYGSGGPLDLSSAVQVGFVVGTLLIGLTGFADRFRASRIFAASAVFGAVANALIAVCPPNLSLIQMCRFATGLALAGVYPVGMKLVVSWDRDAAGRVLGWLVAMLTLGTAFPHMIRYLNAGYDWHVTIIAASILACAAALIVLAIGDGPGAQNGRRTRVHLRDALRAFQGPKLASAALGYLGHMWELYAFWSLVPLLVAATREAPALSVSLMSFLIIATGALGSVIGGFLSRRAGSRAIALIGLAGSAAACAVVPIVQSSSIFLIMLFVWGFFVIPDSPQLSSLAVAACRSDEVASTLAILNGAGFLLTIASIKLSLACWPQMGVAVAWLLLPGPIAGFFALFPFQKVRDRAAQSASRFVQSIW